MCVCECVCVYVCVCVCVFVFESAAYQRASPSVGVCTGQRRVGPSTIPIAIVVTLKISIRMQYYNSPGTGDMKGSINISN